MVFIRAILGWLGILAVAIISGGLRDHFIRPRFGLFAAELYGAFVLSTAIVFVAVVVMRPAVPANRRMAAMYLSIEWVVLTLAFEFLFFHYITGRSWNELFAAYRLWEGRLWSVVVFVVATAPFIAGKWLASRGAIGR
ncbi:MAG TPA: hypothetical protein VN622_00600 [Clostridia bacterium]|nr:hypothetical protein [Clostridia bacterium]